MKNDKAQMPIKKEGKKRSGGVYLRLTPGGDKPRPYGVSGKMKKMRLNSQARQAFQGSSRGFSLIEVVIAIALIGIIVVAIMGSLSYATMVLIITDRQATAESLARSQLEFVKNQDYDDINTPPQYIQLPEIPDSYDIVITAERLDPNNDGTTNDDGIQKITVIIKHDDKEVITMDNYKRNPEIEE